MMKKLQKIVFFGTEDFSLSSLKALVEGNFSVAAVVTKPDTPRGRGHKLTPPPVKLYAQQHNIPVLQPKKITDISEKLRTFAPATGVLVSYGKIIPQSIIDIFTPGIINVHPSLLPKYRGPTPIESAILHGDHKTGVSIMQLSARMDAGPVYSQVVHTLDHTETQTTLYATLAKLGAQRLIETLPSIMQGELSATPQNEDICTYCSLLTKDDTFITPASYTVAQLEQKIRAHIVFPKTKIKHQSGILTLLSSTPAKKQENSLTLQCKDGYLQVDTIMSPHGKSMSTDAYLNGIK